MAGRPPERLTPLDFVTAAICLLSALDIGGTVWENAAKAMGAPPAAFCVLVADADRTHPVTPIRNPQGPWPALAQRHKAGWLNLAGSLIRLAKHQHAH